MSKTVVIGALGPTLDRPAGPDRWHKWRPSVAICQQQDLVVDRYVLLTQKNFHKLTNQLVGDLQSVSPETSIEVLETEMSDVWDFQEVYGTLFDIARDLKLDPKDRNLVHITTGSHVMQICLFLLTESRHFPAKLLQTSPALRKNQGPEGSYQIIDLELARYDQLASRFEQQALDDISFLKSGIPTRNPAFNQLIARIEQVAIRSTEPILLMGPTGAGKSQLARRIYDLAVHRRGMTGEFVEVNCATLQGQAAMSALFGHKKGAYTGASADRPGLLRAANKGMLFLDEIGELGLDEQAMLLRAVEEKVFYPLGADTPVKSNFQLICGTNRDLQTQVDSGEFREDLLTRIHLWTFVLPGLAERKEDIEPNLEYELNQIAQRTGKRVRFNREASKAFLDFALDPDARWRGNFRDLNAAVTRMATLATEGRITEEGVNDEIQRLQQHWGSRKAEAAPTAEKLLGTEKLQNLDLFDRLQLEGVLTVCQNCRSLAEAGRRLFDVSRQNKQTQNDSDRIRKYLAKFGLSWDDVK
ncbi:MAG: RNA repair transcriptional activator RtcR [Verrucomicrobia bacterium]|nr:RNA repair transcriptional activator RtcR [Verrucomicrobiota bacterium]MCH8512478.1 RNA repair transcriptional activator RtcR [Kiritimatiellia bacterium]